MMTPIDLSLNNQSWRERWTGFSRDTATNRQNCISRLGGLLLAPLNCCGHHWQGLQSEETSWNLLSGIKKVVLVVVILFALIPGTIGSLIQSVSNPSLKQDGSWDTWELEMSPPQQNHCHVLGLYDFYKPDSQLTPTLSHIYSNFLKPTKVSIDKRGHMDCVEKTITLSMNRFGLARPNGNGFLRNLTNGFRPKKVPHLTSERIKILQNLLLGIESGTPEDHRVLRNYLACTTKIAFTTHWYTNQNGLPNKLDLKVTY